MTGGFVGVGAGGCFETFDVKLLALDDLDVGALAVGAFEAVARDVEFGGAASAAAGIAPAC